MVDSVLVPSRLACSKVVLVGHEGVVAMLVGHRLEDYVVSVDGEVLLSVRLPLDAVLELALETEARGLEVRVVAVQG